MQPQHIRIETHDGTEHGGLLWFRIKTKSSQRDVARYTETHHVAVQLNFLLPKIDWHIKNVYYSFDSHRGGKDRSNRKFSQ